MKSRFILLILACSIWAGCSFEPCRQAAFPIKIGLLADSQITSQNGFSNFSYRSKFAKSMVNVAIRPPAIECYLSEEMLKIAMNKLTQDPYGGRKGVDVILYLGDAANSGGTDEINTVLTILAKYREQTGTPIFIIIGNHDYLGAGNVVSPGIRFAMLNCTGHQDNPALTKYEVLRKFSEFNRANNQIAASPFLYEDNIETLERNKNLDHRTGQYLCGILTYKQEGKPLVDFLLMDSSDYKDAPGWSEAADVGFFGVIGSVSFKDDPPFVSQTTYLRQKTQGSPAQFRFLASHYPKDHLDRITFAKPGQVPLDVTNIMWATIETAFAVPTFSKTLNQNLEPLVSSSGKNYWLSAHTHSQTIPHPERFIVGGLMGEKYFTGLNIGSTTDYRASAAIVEQYQSVSDGRLDNFVGYREIPICEPDQSIFVSMPEAIEEYGRQHANDPAFKALIPTMEQWRKEQKTGPGDLLNIGSNLLGAMDDKKTKTQADCYWFYVGATVLGLNRTYIGDAWLDEQTNASAANIKAFVEQFARSTGSDREEVLSFLGLISGASEKGLLFNKSDLSPRQFKKLCKNPE